MNSLPISVVVCCSNDFDVFKLLESIDVSVEVIGALTPNVEIERRFRQMGYRYALTPVGNHAATANSGIALAQHSKILIVDSDCVLDPGAIQAVFKALDVADVVNLPIRFAHTASRLSKAIAACRNFDNTYDRQAYKPGIAFNARLKDRIGGYWYDERIAWPTDSEFLWRIRHHNVDVEHVDGHAIVHRPIGIRHAQRAYRSYGRDGWRRVALLRQTTHLLPLRNLVKKLRALQHAARKDRSVVLNYYFEVLYILGFIEQMIRQPMFKRRTGAA